MEMEEIVEEETSGKHENMVEITVKTIGPARPSSLHVPSSIKVLDLRKLIARKNHLPVENLKLILQGKVLHDRADEDDIYVRFNDGGINFFISFLLQLFIFVINVHGSIYFCLMV
uniref:Ubiquitin-like domain-containing protein n=1 Tax=Gossypium raimondii TaxID=29730 RepID=A0A0D2RPM8_GOSRA|nr:hypothetical protein B456_003G180500 [Gossypium raimondii]